MSPETAKSIIAERAINAVVNAVKSGAMPSYAQTLTVSIEVAVDVAVAAAGGVSVRCPKCHCDRPVQRVSEDNASFVRNAVLLDCSQCGTVEVSRRDVPGVLPVWVAEREVSAVTA